MALRDRPQLREESQLCPQPIKMPVLDWIFAAVLFVSLVLGAWRGLIYEVLSVLSWLAAFILAQWFAPDVAQKLPMTGAGEAVRYAAGVAGRLDRGAGQETFCGYRSAAGGSGFGRGVWPASRCAAIVGGDSGGQHDAAEIRTLVAGICKCGYWHGDAQGTEADIAARVWQILALLRSEKIMCGIVGVVGSAPVNQLLYDALLLLQHRGQDAAGIVTQLNRKFFMHKAKGMVRDVFRTRNMRSLPGNCGLGQVRYPCL